MTNAFGHVDPSTTQRVYADPRSRVVPLQAGEFRLKLTAEERRVLHTVLEMFRDRPEALIGDAASTGAGTVSLAAVTRILGKLPPRDAGTY